MELRGIRQYSDIVSSFHLCFVHLSPMLFCFVLFIPDCHGCHLHYFLSFVFEFSVSCKQQFTRQHINTKSRYTLICNLNDVYFTLSVPDEG